MKTREPECYEVGLLPRAVEVAGADRDAAAQLLGLTPRSLTIRYLQEERGKVSIATLARFADLLGYDLRYEFVARAREEPDLVRRVPPPRTLSRRQTPNRPPTRVLESIEDKVRALPDMHFGALSLIPSKLNIVRLGRSSRISPRELLAMEALLSTKNNVLPINELIKAGWAGEEASISSVRVLVHKLRNRLVAIGLERDALELLDDGYRLTVPESDNPDPGSA